MYIKIFWKGHVVMPEIVDGSYHSLTFMQYEMLILLPNWCSLFKVIDLVKLELFYKLGKWIFLLFLFVFSLLVAVL